MAPAKITTDAARIAIRLPGPSLDTEAGSCGFAFGAAVKTGPAASGVAACPTNRGVQPPLGRWMTIRVLAWIEGVSPAKCLHPH